LLANHQTKIN